MPDNIAVKGASVSLAPVVTSVVITTPTHTLSIASSGPFITSEGNEVLLEADVDASFATYMTEYTTIAFPTAGKLIYQSLKSLSNLSELTYKNAEPIVIKKTEGTITCQRLAPATNSSPASDTTLTYDLDFSFTDAGQTLSSSD